MGINTKGVAFRYAMYRQIGSAYPAGDRQNYAYMEERDGMFGLMDGPCMVALMVAPGVLKE